MSRGKSFTPTVPLLSSVQRRTIAALSLGTLGDGRATIRNNRPHDHFIREKHVENWETFGSSLFTTNRDNVNSQILICSQLISV